MTADADIRAQVRVLNAGLSRRTRMVIAAGNVHNIVLGTAIAVRVSSTSSGTLAREASGTVGAHSTTWTGIAFALINIDTSSSVLRGGSGEAFGAQTLGHIVHDHALSVGRTAHRLARMTAVISNVRLWTEAPLVLVTDGVSRTLIDRLAAHHSNTADPGVRISDCARGTSALKGSRKVVADGSLPARIWFAALVQVDAQSLGVSGESRGTLTGVTPGNVLTNRIVSALSRRSMDDVALIDIDATSGNIAGIEGPTLFADAIRLCAVRLAEGMRSAGNIFTGCFAFHTGWSSNVSGEAVALEGSRSVDALSIGSADPGSCSTLIDIHAHGAIRLESVLAEALAVHALGVVCAVKVGRTLDRNIPLDAS